MRSPIRIAVTGAAGNIGYALVFRIAAGDAFGPDQPVILHLLEIPGLENKLRGLKMEIEDCAFHLVQDVITGVDARRVFEGVDYIAAVGAMPRGPGMERRDLLEKNAQIFVDKGRAIQAAGNLKVKVLVVGNPCNTNALVTMHNAPGIPKENFFSMTMLDQSRARAQIALKLNVNVNTVEINVWGNHSPTMVPDIDNAKVNGKLLEEVLPNRVWLENDFIKTIQNRGYEVINARGISSAASAAGLFWDFFCRSLLHWHPSLSIIFKEIILMQYGINKRLVKTEQAVSMVRQQHTDCSFPCVCFGTGFGHVSDYKMKF